MWVRWPATANASLDASIHQRIYQQHPTSKAVLHAHNPYTIALTLNAKLFTPVDVEGKLYFGDLEVIECDAEHYLQAMPERINQSLMKQPIAIVKSHGVYASADKLELAYKWVSSLEQSAKIKWLANNR